MQAALGKKTYDLIDILFQEVDKQFEFDTIRGPGVGDRYTNRFIKTVQNRAFDHFGEDFSEQRICGNNKLAVDFYFPDEETIVEIALSAHNPSSELEKDLIKAMMAKHNGVGVSTLLIIGKKGLSRKMKQSSYQQMGQWFYNISHIKLAIMELVTPIVIEYYANF